MGAETRDALPGGGSAGNAGSVAQRQPNRLERALRQRGVREATSNLTAGGQVSREPGPSKVAFIRAKAACNALRTHYGNPALKLLGWISRLKQRIGIFLSCDTNRKGCSLQAEPRRPKNNSASAALFVHLLGKYRPAQGPIQGLSNIDGRRSLRGFHCGRTFTGARHQLHRSRARDLPRRVLFSPHRKVVCLSGSQPVEPSGTMRCSVALPRWSLANYPFSPPRG